MLINYFDFLLLSKKEEKKFKIYLMIIKKFYSIFLNLENKDFNSLKKQIIGFSKKYIDKYVNENKLDYKENLLKELENNINFHGNKFIGKHMNNGIEFKEFLFWFLKLIDDEILTNMFGFIPKRNFKRWKIFESKNKRGIKFNLNHDNLIIKWINEYFEKFKKFPKLNLIKSKALEFSDNNNFLASNTWYYKFQNRNKNKLPKKEKKIKNDILMEDLILTKLNIVKNKNKYDNNDCKIFNK